jgi:hypothetical protein
MTGRPPRLPSMFEMLMSASASAARAKAEAARPAWPLNPFPPGIREGSATSRVLAELRRVAPQSLESGQLRFRCNANRGGIAWAVRYLAHQGLIEQIPDPRSPCFRRYRVTEKGLSHDGH